jgi:hypothetical protein
VSLGLRSPQIFSLRISFLSRAPRRAGLSGARGARQAHTAHGSRLEVEERFRSGLRPDRAGGFTSKAPCTPCPAPAPPPRDPSGIARYHSSRPRRRGRRELAHPCARTCAPWTPPAPCRSSAAVTGPWALNPPSMAGRLRDSAGGLRPCFRREWGARKMHSARWCKSRQSMKKVGRPQALGHRMRCP